MFFIMTNLEWIEFDYDQLIEDKVIASSLHTFQQHHIENYSLFEQRLKGLGGTLDLYINRKTQRWKILVNKYKNRSKKLF